MIQATTPTTAPTDASPVQAMLDGILAVGSPGSIVLSLGVVFLVWFLRRTVLRVVGSRVEDVRHRYQWSKVSGYVAFLVAAVLLGAIWLPGLRSLGTFFGLLTAGLAIALRDPVLNLAGFGFIVWRRPFELGDRISVGEVAGDVVDVRIFQFTLLEIGNWVHADQSTGRLIHVPNARVFTTPVANFTQEFPFIWNELRVLVTFESDWRAAKKLLLGLGESVVGEISEAAESHVRRASRKYLIYYSKLTPAVYTSVEESGVQLTLRYLCSPRRRRGTAEQIWEQLLDALATEPSIDLAYPTTRFYDHGSEGKPALRAPPQSGAPDWQGSGDATSLDGPRRAATDAANPTD